MHRETPGVLNQAIAPMAAPTTPPVRGVVVPDSVQTRSRSPLARVSSKNETNAVPLQISRRHAEAFQIQPGAVE